MPDDCTRSPGVHHLRMPRVPAWQPHAKSHPWKQLEEFKSCRLASIVSGSPHKLAYVHTSDPAQADRQSHRYRKLHPGLVALWPRSAATAGAGVDPEPDHCAPDCQPAPHGHGACAGNAAVRHVVCAVRGRGQRDPGRTTGGCQRRIAAVPRRHPDQAGKGQGNNRTPFRAPGTGIQGGGPGAAGHGQCGAQEK